MQTPSSPEEMTNRQDRQSLIALLHREKLATRGLQLMPLGGDGSDRRFLRISREDGPGLIAVLPAATLPKAHAEARSCFLIGRHLHSRGVPVPAIHAYEEETGIVVFEDLGDVLLHERVRRLAGRPEAVLAWYRQAVEALIRLQLDGSVHFSPEFCWDGERYDRQLMLERESGYFLRAFCRDFLGLEECPAGIDDEFQELAEAAANLPAHYLLHRDFQSRNLMVRGEELVIIDFQGARFGPLGYDLASLLLDPYADLNSELQESILSYYVSAVVRRLGMEEKPFREGYYLLRLQRNLQIIGAYAFLSFQRGKPFFRQYLLPALGALDRHLRSGAGAGFPCLRALAAECLALTPRRLAAGDHLMQSRSAP